MIRNHGILLPPPTVHGYIDKEDCQLKMLETSNPTQNELYPGILLQVPQFCLYVVLVSSRGPCPLAQGDAISDRALRLLFSLTQ